MFRIDKCPRETSSEEGQDQKTDVRSIVDLIILFLPDV